jgi:2-methylcitrate dehydratase PrpD
LTSTVTERIVGERSSMTASTTGAAAPRFARFACELDLARVPDPVLEAVSLHLLDVLGCGLAAVGTGAAPYARALGEASAPGPASALGLAVPVAADRAALVNGITCHALDFDDTHPASIAHVSAVVAPAALAAAQAHGSSGAELTRALLAGNEIACRVGRVAGDAFHLRGFHPTAICGVFGATAAVATLRGLDEAAAAHALGIAGSMAGGLMAYLSDGSETKRVHPGWMAHAAHVAAELAAHGATGPAAVLEGMNGVYPAFLGREDVDADALAADLGVVWDTPTIAFKPYPACHFVHAPLDALRALVAEHGFAADAIERITVCSPRAGIELVADPLERKRRPATPYESKFSAPFALAAWLHAGEVDATTFGEPLLSDPRVLELAALVDWEEREYDTFPASLPGGVRVHLRGGEVLERHLPHQRGDARNPLGVEELRAKFRANAETALAPAEAQEIERAVLGLRGEPELGALALIGRASQRPSSPAHA